MKPLFAAQRLQICAQHIARGEPLSPSLRHWMCSAIAERMESPPRTLDQLLGISSRSGGRLHAGSKLPKMHHAICQLAVACEGTPSHRAALLARRIEAYRRTPDPDLAAIESHWGRMPGTPRQLQKILAGKTEAVRQGAEAGILKPNERPHSTPSDTIRAC